jgi:DNA polymerase delta subunit 3
LKSVVELTLFLVTVEEPSWESFSEDEPAPPPPKKKPVVNAPKGKPGAKAGQGNIMSFFGKK